MTIVSQGEFLTVMRFPPPSCAAVALMHSRIMTQRHECLPSLPLGKGRMTHLSHYAVLVRCIAPYISGGWQRGSIRYSMLSSTLANLLKLVVNNCQAVVPVCYRAGLYQRST